MNIFKDQKKIKEIIVQGKTYEYVHKIDLKALVQNKRPIIQYMIVFHRGNNNYILSILSDHTFRLYGPRNHAWLKGQVNSINWI